MAEKEELIKEKIEYSGLFNFPAFYSFAHSWFKENDHGVNEDKYSEKVSGNKRDITIEWKATRKITDYFKGEYKIKFEIRDLVDVEAEINGSKEKMNQGKVSAEIKGIIISDFQSKWDKSAFSRFMRDFYNKFVIPSRVKQIKDEIIDTVRDFKEQLKAFLELTGRQ